MTRGIMPDRHLGTAIAAAHNEMMVSRWLDDNAYGDRFRGTIRVNPDDIAGALREIDKYKDHPARRADRHPDAVPRAVRQAAVLAAVGGGGRSGAAGGRAHRGGLRASRSPPTPSGNTRTYEQYVGFMALNYLYHLMNMIAEGVFERMPTLKFVWADGAADMLTPFIWRMDCFGRPHLEQTPWAPKMPSDYLPGHVYFIQGAIDGPGDTDFAGEWFGFTGKEDMVMFGSSYPHWQLNELTVPAAYSAEQRDKLCWRNAAQLYGIDVGAGRCSRTVARSSRSRGGHDDGHNHRRGSPPPSASPSGASTPTSTRCPGAAYWPSTSLSRGAASTSCTRKVGDQIYYDAPDYAHAYAMRVDTFPADGEFAGSDPDLAFKQLIMEAGADIAILEPAAYPARLPEAQHAMCLRAQRLAGQPLAGQPQQLARAVAWVDLRWRSRSRRSPSARSSVGPGTRTWRRF